MTYRYMTQDEMDTLSHLLNDNKCVENTIATWVRTRLLGCSASMSIEGNVSASLLRAFDELKIEIDEHRQNESEQ